MVPDSLIPCCYTVACSTPKDAVALPLIKSFILVAPPPHVYYRGGCTPESYCSLSVAPPPNHYRWLHHLTHCLLQVASPPTAGGFTTPPYWSLPSFPAHNYSYSYNSFHTEEHFIIIDIAYIHVYMYSQYMTRLLHVSETQSNISLRASMGNGKCPVPNTDFLCTPGRKRSTKLGSTTQSTASGAKLTPSGQIIGQKGADLHNGVTNVPTALQFLICLITLGMMLGGGQIQLFSWPQLHVKASTASVPHDQNLELNLGSYVFMLLAKRSTVCGPHMHSNHSNITGFSIQSSISNTLLM